MLALLKKEINSFLNSLIGYIVVAVFLLLVGLFLWVFEGNFNIFDMGEASLENLFVIAPWVFMFLIPAITMRSFSEEKRTGTIELLLTKPLTDFKIVMAKFLAGILLVLFALLPTLIYFYSVYSLASPVGNVDIGATIGSYIGLLFMGSGFVSMGIFASSVSSNQVVAFILAVFLCFFVYIGFESIALFDMFGSLDLFLTKLGINEHYRSISRGVIDSRDILYFLSLDFFFLYLTKLMLQSRKW